MYHQHRRINFSAIYALERLLSTSLGPKGLDKVIVDDELNETTITNDGATIMSKLPFENPLAIILKQLAHSVDTKVGDGTTSAVLLACRLLAGADRLLDEHYHPNTIVQGYQIALQKCKEIIDSMAVHLDSREKSMYLIATTSLHSKILNSFSKLFVNMCIQSINLINNNSIQDQVQSNNNNSSSNSNYLDNIKYLKILGGSISDTTLLHGIMIKARFSIPKMSKSISNVKLLLIDFEFGELSQSISLLLSISYNQKELIEKDKREFEIKQAQIIIDYLNNNNKSKEDKFIVLSTKRIPSSCITMFYNNGINCASPINEDDMNLIVKVSGSQLVHSLVQIEGNNDSNMYISTITQCREVIEKNSQYYLEIKNQVESNSICTFIVRGPNTYTIEEVQRSLNDALSVMLLVRDYPTIIPGGGATEIELYTQLQSYQHQLQLNNNNINRNENIKLSRVISIFSESLLTIPTLLYKNAGFDSITLLSKLKKLHNQNNNNNNNENINYKEFSVNLNTGELTSMISLGIVEPINAKKNMLTMVVDTVSMLIRIDQSLIYNKED